MKIGTRVKIKSGVDFYAGREGVVVEFDPKLKWGSSPRALLCPEQCICVHMIPKTSLEMREGSPLAMIFEHELTVLPDDPGRPIPPHGSGP